MRFAGPGTRGAHLMRMSIMFTRETAIGGLVCAPLNALISIMTMAKLTLRLLTSPFDAEAARPHVPLSMPSPLYRE